MEAGTIIFILILLIFVGYGNFQGGSVESARENSKDAVIGLSIFIILGFIFGALGFSC